MYNSSINYSLIRYLYELGYPRKLVRVITGYDLDYITKILNSNSPVLPSIANITEEQSTRKFVLDRFLECRPLPTIVFGKQDKIYIKLLALCMVDTDKIRKLYYNAPQFKVSKAWRRAAKYYNFDEFMPQYIGLTNEEYKLFLRELLK